MREVSAPSDYGNSVIIRLLLGIFSCSAGEVVHYSSAAMPLMCAVDVLPAVVLQSEDNSFRGSTSQHIAIVCVSH